MGSLLSCASSPNKLQESTTFISIVFPSENHTTFRFPVDPDFPFILSSFIVNQMQYRPFEILIYDTIHPRMTSYFYVPTSFRHTSNYIQREVDDGVFDVIPFYKQKNIYSHPYTIWLRIKEKDGIERPVALMISKNPI
jgi:hypothetical protein